VLTRVNPASLTLRPNGPLFLSPAASESTSVALGSTPSTTQALKVRHKVIRRKATETGRNQPTASIRHPAPNARGQALRTPRSALRIQITGRNRTQCDKSTTYAELQSDPAHSAIPACPEGPMSRGTPHSALRTPHWYGCVER